MSLTQKISDIRQYIGSLEYIDYKKKLLWRNNYSMLRNKRFKTLKAFFVNFEFTAGLELPIFALAENDLETKKMTTFDKI